MASLKTREDPRTTARCVVKAQIQKNAPQNKPKQEQDETQETKIAGEKKIFLSCQLRALVARKPS
jgi:hypothetical protein